MDVATVTLVKPIRYTGPLLVLTTKVDKLTSQKCLPTSHAVTLSTFVIRHSAEAPDVEGAGASISIYPVENVF